MMSKIKFYIVFFLAFILASSEVYCQSSSANSRPQFIDVKKADLGTQQSSIVWINPDVDLKQADQDKFVVKAGVLSNEKLKSVKLFINGVEEPSIRGYEISNGDKPNFNEVIDKLVTLTRKSNEVKIVAETSSGLVLSDKRQVTLKGMPEDRINIASTPEVSATASKLTSQLGIKKNYALLIGVQEYADMALNTLTTPLADVQDVQDVLSTNYTFDKENITVLTNPQWSDIVKVFDRLATIVTPGDNLLIFYSGHGAWDKQTKKGYWLPANAKKSDKFDWYSNADLKDHIAAINSKHTLLVSDATFFGSVLKVKEVFTKKPTPEAEMERFKLASRQAMTSGSLITVPDKSIFIKYFIKGLKENQASYVSAEQLFISFKSGVQNNGPNGQIPRFGEVTETGDAGGDFIFIRK
ncbi:MAG TPA: caspase family protein [Cytophagaceae bacterium]|jgi:hypothetical protein